MGCRALCQRCLQQLCAASASCCLALHSRHGPRTSQPLPALPLRVCETDQRELSLTLSRVRWRCRSHHLYFPRPVYCKHAVHLHRLQSAGSVQPVSPALAITYPLYPYRADTELAEPAPELPQSAAQAAVFPERRQRCAHPQPQHPAHAPARQRPETPGHAMRASRCHAQPHTHDTVSVCTKPFPPLRRLRC
jgi:hypothetical protein